jgi:hypothetical protein
VNRSRPFLSVTLRVDYCDGFLCCITITMGVKLCVEWQSVMIPECSATHDDDKDAQEGSRCEPIIEGGRRENKMAHVHTEYGRTGARNAVEGEVRGNAPKYCTQHSQDLIMWGRKSWWHFARRREDVPRGGRRVDFLPMRCMR